MRRMGSNWWQFAWTSTGHVLSTAKGGAVRLQVTLPVGGTVDWVFLSHGSAAGVLSGLCCWALPVRPVTQTVHTDSPSVAVNNMARPARRSLHFRHHASCRGVI